MCCSVCNVAAAGWSEIAMVDFEAELLISEEGRLREIAVGEVERFAQ